MELVFADTAYWRAVFDEDDKFHLQAKVLQRSLQMTHKIVTSEMVLTEFLNAYAEYLQIVRVAAHQTVEDIRKDANIVVVPQTTAIFTQALRHYGQYPDKGWSHTDCASMLIMQQQHIREVLTPDRHFAQAGFTILF